MNKIHFWGDEYFPVYKETADPSWAEFAVSLPDDVLEKIRTLWLEWQVIQQVLGKIDDDKITVVDGELWRKMEETARGLLVKLAT